MISSKPKHVSEAKSGSLDDLTPSEWDAAAAWLRESKDEPERFDCVDKPEHYNQGDVECIDAIKSALGQDGFISYLRGNVMKYLWRCEKKNMPVTDLRKARWYIERLIKEELLR